MFRPSNQAGFYIGLGTIYVAIFALLVAANRDWTNLATLSATAAALVLAFLLLRGRSGLDRWVMHGFVAVVCVQQLVVLYLQRDVPNIGLVWFIIVPALVATLGRAIDILLWTPVTCLCLVLAYRFAAADEALAHPLSLPNLLGALTFMAIVSYRFLQIRERREAQLTAALGKAQAEVGKRQEAEAVARRAQQQTTRFLASMSHELRSPMTSMMLSAELLKRGAAAADPESLVAVNRIHESTRVTINLLNDVLDLAKIEADKTSPRPEPFALLPLLEDVRVLMEPHAMAAGTTLALLAGPELPTRWIADPACVRQVLVNLVSNAIKHTTNGLVQLCLRRMTHGIEFLVQDNGVGIAEADQTRIFDPFVQLTAATQFGTGLGLTLSRRYARLTGGSVELVSSQSPGGSTFRFCVPGSDSSSSNLGSHDSGSGVAGLDLDGAAWRVSAPSPEIGCWAESWIEFWGGTLNDRGTELTLAPSASGSIGDIHALAEQLRPPVAAALGVTEPLPESPAATIAEPLITPAAGRGRCLICDDSEMIREVLATVLQSLGYATVAVADAVAALQALRSDSFGFVLLDVQLGVDSGIDLLRTIRSQPGALARLPVCMISGSLHGQEEAKAAGADEFLLKPPKLPELARVAATLIGRPD